MRQGAYFKMVRGAQRCKDGSDLRIYFNIEGTYVDFRVCTEPGEGRGFEK